MLIILHRNGVAMFSELSPVICAFYSDLFGHVNDDTQFANGFLKSLNAFLLASAVPVGNAPDGED